MKSNGACNIWPPLVGVALNQASHILSSHLTFLGSFATAQLSVGFAPSLQASSLHIARLRCASATLGAFLSTSFFSRGGGRLRGPISADITGATIRGVTTQLWSSRGHRGATSKFVSSDCCVTCMRMFRIEYCLSAVQAQRMFAFILCYKARYVKGRIAVEATEE